MSTTIYDYIVVGAGSSGAAVAARLSEDAPNTVLLLEAGPAFAASDPPMDYHAANVYAMTRQRQYFWPNLKTRLTSVQRPRDFLAARIAGGGSAINGQVAVRPLPEDFDRWAEQGCAGWSGDDVLPYFKKLEDDLDFGADSVHGTGGPIPVFRPPREQWGTVDLALRRAALALGYPWSDDLNHPASTGVCSFPCNRRNGRRVSTNEGYLEPARNRVNLSIVGSALVDRVLFDGRRATGVRMGNRDGARAYYGREVILCAGAIQSPAILMRSGIGPSEWLRSLGIKVIADLAVGEHLQDHPIISYRLALRRNSRSGSPFSRNSNCCLRYTSGKPGTGRDDMFAWSMDSVGFDENSLRTGLLGLAVYEPGFPI